MAETFSDAQPVGGAIATHLAEEIEKRVGRIRFLKSVIEQTRQESGIVANEQEIEQYRAELLNLCHQHKELTGTNWQDEQGYARYVAPGEGYKYDQDRVDEVSAALLGLLGELDELADDGPTLIEGEVSVEAVLGKSEDGRETVSEPATDPKLLLVALQSQYAAYRRLVEEANLRLAAMDREMKRLAAARKTSKRAEHVSIQ